MGQELNHEEISRAIKPMHDTFKVLVVKPVCITKVPEGSNITPVRFFQIQVLSEDPMAVKSLPMSINIFETQQPELFNIIHERAKRWRNFPHMLIGKRIIGQRIIINTPPYHIMIKHANGTYKPLTSVRYNPKTDKYTDKPLPCVSNTMKVFVHHDEDPWKTCQIHFNKYVKPYILQNT